MADHGWWPVATGLVTAAIAVWVAFALVTPEAETEDANAVPEVAVASTGMTEIDAIAATSADVTDATVVITRPPLELDGLSQAISRVLSTGGFATEMSPDDLESQLPPSIYRTLVQNDVVLTVATGGDGG
jgi:hypothetical protein